MAGTIIRVSKYFTEADLERIATRYSGKIKIAFGDNDVDQKRTVEAREHSGGQASALRSKRGHYWDRPHFDEATGQFSEASAFGITTTYYESGVTAPSIRDYKKYLNERKDILLGLLEEDGVLIVPCDEHGVCTIGAGIAQGGAGYGRSHSAAIDEMFRDLEKDAGAKQVRLTGGEDFWPHAEAALAVSAASSIASSVSSSATSSTKSLSQTIAEPVEALLDNKMRKIFNYLRSKGVNTYDGVLEIDGSRVSLQEGGDGSFSSLSLDGAKMSIYHDSRSEKYGQAEIYGEGKNVEKLKKIIFDLNESKMDDISAREGLVSSSISSSVAAPSSEVPAASKQVPVRLPKSSFVYSSAFYTEESFAASEAAAKSGVRVINLFGDDEATKTGRKSRTTTARTQTEFLRRADGTFRDQGEDSVAFGITTTKWQKGTDGKMVNLLAAMSEVQYANYMREQFEQLKRIIEQEKDKGNDVVIVVPSSADSSHSLGTGKAGLPTSHLDIIAESLNDLMATTRSDFKVDKKGGVVDKVVAASIKDRKPSSTVLDAESAKVKRGERSIGIG